MHFRVADPIIAIDQGHADLCWLAATTTLFSWKAPQPLTMQQAANRLGVEFIAAFASGTALLYDQLELWRSRAGFSREGQQCLDAAGWESLLRAHGPLVTLIDGNGANNINHAVVIAGIHGDGGAGTTALTVVNGQGGVIETRSLSNFVSVFELPEGNDQLFSVMYFAS